MESNLTLYSFSDLKPYTLPEEVHLGQLGLMSDYEQMEFLGRGALSQVYKAKRKKDNKIWAIKCLRKTDKRPLRKEAFREINILRNLDHDNIIKLEGLVLFTEPNNLCLVLEYCPNTLVQLIDDCPSKIPLNQIKGISKQIFRGLDFLHKNYVIHRDLKPGNLLISANGELKIIDFDMSRTFADQGVSKTKDKSLRPMTPNVITLWYRSPELLFEAPTYGPKADVWSAGCIVIELFLKKPFLKGKSDINQCKLIEDLLGAPNELSWPGFRECRHHCNTPREQRNRYNRLDERLSDLGFDEDLMDIIRHLLVYDPKKRYKAEDCYYHNWFDVAPFPAKKIEIPKELKNSRPQVSILNK